MNYKSKLKVVVINLGVDLPIGGPYGLGTGERVCMRWWTMGSLYRRRSFGVRATMFWEIIYINILILIYYQLIIFIVIKNNPKFQYLKIMDIDSEVS
jgi:hypothetical protein